MPPVIEEKQLTLPAMSHFADTIYRQKYAMQDEHGNLETWDQTAFRVTKFVLGALGYVPEDVEFQKVYHLIKERKLMPGGRYLYASGRSLHQTQNCLLLRVSDSREGWADLLSKAVSALSTGAGIGCVYSDVRPSGTPIKRTGGEASGPCPLMQMVDAVGRGVMQGGSRRSAIWAGLAWDHGDIETFIRIKDWSPEMRALKDKDLTFALPMEFTNVSVILDDNFFAAYDDSSHPDHEKAHRVYDSTLSKMLTTAEPGFSIDVGENAGENLRNACTEVTSRDDSDICNLASLNMSRIETKEEMGEAVKYAALFLLSGTEYSDVPYAKVGEVRQKNRRLGLGLLGLHEWLLQRGHRYEPNEELGEWLGIWEESGRVAAEWADKHELSHPVKTRAVAPTGTIAILAGSTSGIEPIFCRSYKRRYLKGSTWMYQFVIDPSARRMVEDYGIDPNEIEDAYSLSEDVERRIIFQRFVQSYCDHGISSTINLPGPITNPEEVSKFGKIMYRHLPHLRGITCYPDGARGGQPLTPVPYEEALAQEGMIFEEAPEDASCLGGSCGI